MYLQVFLFGPMRIMRGNKILKLPSSVQARSLLAYLLVHQTGPHSRVALAGKLWPEKQESLALRSLSQALWQIRNTIQDLVDSDRQVIWVKGDSIWLDIEEFQTLIKDEKITLLYQAIELYRGEFLEGFYDEWVFGLRERLREEYLRTLGNILLLEKRAGHYNNALSLGRRILQEDPLQEEVHCELMRLYMALEQPLAAVKQFEICCQVLRDELNIEPNNETIRLYKEISQRTNTTPAFEERKVLPPLIETANDFFTQKLPLIGREEERRILIDLIDNKLFTGEGWVALVEGEAGVGKTRLMEEIARDVEWRGGQVLWGRGREMEVSSPFGPLVDAINAAVSPLRAGQLCQVVPKPWLQVLKPLLPELEAMLPQLPSAPALDADQEQVRLLEAIVRFLGEWVKITPLVFILEDVHWFDKDTMGLLPGLVSRVSETGLLLIITYRGEEARAYPPLWEKLQAIDAIGRHTRLYLPRLNALATGELIRSFLAIEREAPIFESRLYQETEGNPLFILETLRTLYAEGLLLRDQSGDWSTPWDETTLDYAELPLPPVVERVIARRLDRLESEIRNTLNAAAVLGNRFDFDWLRASTEQAPATLLKIAGELVRRQFWLEMPEAYGFIHDKIRQVTYQAIELDERARLHLQTGEALEKLHPDGYTRLSFHFNEGHNWEKAAFYSYHAGNKAAIVYANQEALGLYNRALDALEKLPEFNDPARIFEIQLARETVYARLGERESQAEELKNLEVLALQAGNDEKEIHRNQAKVALRKAQYAEATSNSELSITAAQAVIHHAQIAMDVETQAAGHLEWGVGLWRQGDYKESLPHLEQALTLARAANAGRLEADSLRNLGNVCWFQGDYTGAIDYFRKTLDVCTRINDRLGEARTLNNLGLMAEHQGDNSGGRAYYTQALAIYAEVGDRRGESNTFTNLANIDLYQGDYMRARANYEQALPIRQAVGDQEGEAIVLTNLGIVWNHLGHYANSKEYFEQALRVFQEHENRWGEGYLLAYLGLRAHQMGDNESALMLCEQAMLIAQELDSPEHQAHTLAFSGHALTAIGQLDQAMEAYQKALALRKEFEQPHLVAETRAGLARLYLLLGELSQAQSQVEAILEHLKKGSVDGTEEPARIYLTCFQVLLANKDPRADNILSTVYSLLEERAAKIDDPALRRSFLENVVAHQEIMAAYKQRQEQKITVRLPIIEAPTGRPLKADEWVDVTWTLYASVDYAIKGKTACRQHRLRRLLDEAQSQGAAPTVADLAVALDVSTATIKRDLAVLRESGLHIQTRGSRGSTKNEPKV